MNILSVWPTTVEGWVGLIILIVGLISAIIGLIPTAIKLIRTLKILVKNRNFGKIKDIALEAIKAAEASGASGSDKKNQVISAVSAGCIEAGIDLDTETLEELSKYIDEMVAYFNDMKAANKSIKK